MNDENADEVPSGGVAPEAVLRRSLRQVLAFDERHRHTARQLLLVAGVWLPPDVYSNWPVLMPWVVRHNKARKLKDRMGTADPKTGYERQDNSPIGRVRDGLKVEWATHPNVFKQRPLGKGWWQCHCWDSAATEPLTNSFLPNLVWLPEAIGRLTDPLAGDELVTVFQQEAQTIAWSLYRYLPVAAALEETVESVWAGLGEPPTAELSREERELVNWFKATPAFHTKRQKQYLGVYEAVTRALAGRSVQGVGLTPDKYRDSLPGVSQRGLIALQQHLEPFARAAEAFRMPETVKSAVTKAPASGGKAGEFLVTTSAGTVGPLGRSRAGLEVIRGVITNGASPEDVLTCIPAGAFTSVEGTLTGDALVVAMKEVGVKDVPKNWFVDKPIHVDARTWVVSSNRWTEAYEQKKMPKLAELGGGAVSYRKLDEKEPRG